jgi:hypothetical protein
MTIIFGLATGPLALVCADTRINISHHDGSKSHRDEGKLNLILKDGSIASYASSARKLRRFAGGWAAATGNWLVSYYCLDALARSNARTPVSIDKLLQTTYADNRDRIIDSFPNDSGIDKTVIAYVYFTTAGFRLKLLDFGLGVQAAEDSNIFLSKPPTIDDELYTHLLHRVKSVGRIATIDDVFLYVQTIASVFQDAHQADESVSNIIEVGLSIINEQHKVESYHLLAPNPTVIGMSAAAIRATLLP